MTPLSLLNYTKEIPVAQLKKSEKLDARDIDEESPNKFVAYVDDAPECYDVCININPKKEIVASTCECENQNGFCVHKLALMRYLVTQKNKTAIVKTARKRKLSEVEELLFHLDSNALRLWTADLLKKNKDLEILFLNEFKTANTEFTSVEIMELITSTVKSVIKNKKNIDASQLKKTLELLDSSLKPVMTFLTTNIAKPETVSLLKAIFDGMINFEENVYINSIKIQRFVEKIGNEFLLTLHNVKDFDVWKETVTKLFDVFMPQSKGVLHLYEINFVEHIYDKSSQAQEKNSFYLEKWMQFLDYLNKNKLELSEAKYESLIQMCIDNNVFDKYNSYFKPIKYANSYNVMLMNELILAKKYDLVVTYANKQIEQNHYESYNAIYYKILRSVYLLQKDDEKFLKIVYKMMMVEYDFQDYLLIKNSKNILNFDEIKKKIFSQTTHIFRSSNTTAQTFYLQLMIEEKENLQLQKRIEGLSSLLPIIETFNNLLDISKSQLLKNIARIEINYSWHIDSTAINKIRLMIKEKYTIAEIQDFKKQNRLLYSHKIFEPILENKV